ncbi:MAG TPA: GntR family transcriptional regulator [Candidatus Nanopelagicales bacterium]|nr:GntR family transcriptional regulator [Candidatus Nanopelagicales bacterium]
MDRGLPTPLLHVDRESATPVHVQIAAWLRQAIARGELAPGDRLPGERDLAERLGVSRMTLRQALADLESAGEIVRVAGRAGGAFVAEPRIEVDLTHLTGLTDQLTRAGRRAGARVLSASSVSPSPDVAHALALPARAQAIEVVRVRLANRVPVALETSWFTAHLVPGLLDRSLQGSLYAVLRKHYRIDPVSAQERLHAVLADDTTAPLLDVELGTPLVAVERTAYDASGTPVEFAHDLFRCDRVEFLVHRTPDEPVTLRALTDAD